MEEEEAEVAVEASKVLPAAINFGQFPERSSPPPLNEAEWDSVATMSEYALTRMVWPPYELEEADLQRLWARSIRAAAQQMILYKTRKDRELAMHARHDEEQHQLLLQKQQELEEKRQAEAEEREKRRRELEERRVRERQQRLDEMARITEGTPLCGIHFGLELLRRLHALPARQPAEGTAPAALAVASAQDGEPSPLGVAVPDTMGLLEAEFAVANDDDDDDQEGHGDQGYWVGGDGQGNLDFGIFDEGDRDNGGAADAADAAGGADAAASTGMDEEDEGGGGGGGAGTGAGSGAAHGGEGAPDDGLGAAGASGAAHAAGL